MKVNKIFHWLYFLMLLLPVFAIPIFAIYSQRHEINNNVVQRDEPLYLNVKQEVFNGLPNGTDNITTGGGNITISYNEIFINNLEGDYELYFTIDTPLLTDHKYLTSFMYKNDANSLLSSSYIFSDFDTLVFYEDFTISLNDDYITFSSITNCNFNSVGTTLYFGFSGGYGETYVKNVQLFDLTVIFGSGNEPSVNDFNTWLNGRYIDYGTHSLEYGTHVVTYNDTDIGSQFIYQMYNVIDKYFNYDNVFNFGDLYSWLQVNFFSGNVPLGFFIFWHYLIYFLLTSLLWLLFDVLMYVPNLIHKWLDKAS